MCLELRVLFTSYRESAALQKPVRLKVWISSFELFCSIHYFNMAECFLCSVPGMMKTLELLDIAWERLRRELLMTSQDLSQVFFCDVVLRG